MSVQYTQSELKAIFPAAFFLRGQQLYDQQKVLDVIADGEVLVARVQGGQEYRQRVRVGLRNGKLVIEGKCSCPIGRNCKHVVAVLIHTLHHPPSIRLLSSESAHAESPSGIAVETPHKSGYTGDLLIHHWLTNMERRFTKTAAVEQENLLLYVLSPVPLQPLVSVQLMRARRKKDGGIGKAVPYGQFQEVALGRGSGNLVTDIDRNLCNRIYRGSPSHIAMQACLGGPGSGDLYIDMVKTGRVYWLVADSPVLCLAESRASELYWQMDEYDNQKPALQLEPDEVLLPLEPLWYVNFVTGATGMLQHGLSPDVLNLVLQAPPIPAPQIGRVMQTLRQQFANIPWPEPQHLQMERLPDVIPVPFLQLKEMVFEQDSYWRRGEGFRIRLPAANVSFSYHDIRVGASSQDAEVSERHNGVRRLVKRNLAEESRRMTQLKAETGLRLVAEFSPGLQGAEDDSGVFGYPDQGRWQQFMLEDVSFLTDEGWCVETDESFPFQVAASEGELTIEISESSGYDWFRLDLGIDIEGERVSLLPILMQALRQHTHEEIVEMARVDETEERNLVCRLPDKRLLSIPLHRLKGVLSVLVELYDGDAALDEHGGLEMNQSQAARLAELEAHSQARWLGGERLLEMGRRLRNFSGIESVSVPEGFAATLRPYQQTGLNWLQFLRQYELGGILADDMGLGKTLQALAHILVERREGRADLPCLVVAPTSLMFNWRAEAQRFASDLRVLILHGNERHQYFDRLGEYDLILTTYPLLSRDRDVLIEQAFHLLILDEAHAIKNPKAQATQIVHQLRARHRLALTGTPMENHLGELWSLFHFLMPGLLGSAELFKRQFRTPIEKHNDVLRRQMLTHRIKPFLLRRTKAQVLDELPPRTDMVRSCELAGSQRDLYESVRSMMQDRIRREISEKGFKRSQIVILDALLKLRQICCDPRLLKLSAGTRVQHSSKLELLNGMLPELVEEGRRILLFSQFTSMLDLIEPELRRVKIPFVRLSGDTRNREIPVNRFQNGEVPLFLISLKAGGTGLNLTTADTVIHYDPWWNPAVEDQATGRAHRMGQVNPVFVYKLITTGTVEEKILHMQARKRELTSGIIDEPGTGVSLFTPDELMGLFDAGP